MTTISDRYRALAARFTDTVDGVADGAWANPSPCEGWTARQVVAHVVDSSRSFFGRAGLPTPDVPAPEDDPAAAWAALRDAVTAALEDPTTATHEYSGMFGSTTFERTVDQFLSVDLVVHGWDLARATGQDERIDPDEAASLLAALEPRDEILRSSGSFGPKVEPAPGADAQTRLLNFLGRRV